MAVRRRVGAAAEPVEARGRAAMVLRGVARAPQLIRAAAVVAAMVAGPQAPHRQPLMEQMAAPHKIPLLAARATPEADRARALRDRAAAADLDQVP